MRFLLPCSLALASVLGTPDDALAQVDDCTSFWCDRGANAPRSMRPDVAYSTSAELGIAVWEDTTTHEVWYRTFDELGYRPRPAYRLATSAGRPRVAANGSEFMVVYEDYSRGPGTRRVMTKRMPTSYLTCTYPCWVLPPPRVLASEGGQLDEFRPEVMPMEEPGQYAISWTSNRVLNPLYPSGNFMMRVSTAPAPGFCYPGPCDDGMRPTGGAMYHQTGEHPQLGHLGDWMWTAYVEPDSHYLSFATFRESDVLTWNFWTSQYGVEFYDPTRQLIHDFDSPSPWPYAATNLGLTIEPRVAAGHRNNDTASFLMVWEEARPVPGEDDQSVYGMCVEVSPTTGQILDSSGHFEIAYDLDAAKTRPHVVYIPQQEVYLVVWGDEEQPSFWTWSTNVRGRFVSCEGSEPVVDDSFWIDSQWRFSGLPRVATDGAAAFVVYEEDTASGDRVYLRRIQRQNGQPVLGAQLPLN